MDFGVIVDLETTGLNVEKDEIIEIGILEFAVDSEKPPVITGMYSALQDPQRALDPVIVELTGLDNDLLAGRNIDWRIVKDYFSRASIAIAHNAEFEIGFLRKRQEMQPFDIHWACSQRHIKWHNLGYKSKQLTYLAADHGFLNPFPHRALMDCATTFKLVAPYLQELIERSYEKELKIYAAQSPFAVKDLLKTRGYHWDQEKRSWFKTVFESDLDSEVNFLKSQIYQGDSRHQLEEIAKIY